MTTTGVPEVSTEWMTIPLSQNYLEPPVVIASLGAQFDNQPGIVRVQNVTDNSFQIRFDQWEDIDQSSDVQKQVFYLVSKVGLSSIESLKVEAGKVSSNNLAPNVSKVDFETRFTAIPAIFTGVLTANDEDLVVPRVLYSDSSGFDVGLQEQESKNNGHIEEEIGWIAIEKGVALNSSFNINVLDVSASHIESTIQFPVNENVFSPIVVHTLGSYYGRDTAVSSLTFIKNDGLGVYVQEEKSRDDEMNHAKEKIGIFFVN